MTKINVKRKNFTICSNTFLQDNKLSLRARGLMSYMVSLPEDWDFSVKGLSSLVPEGRDAVRNALKELEDNDYLIRRQVKENGKFGKIEFDLYEDKHTDSTSNGNPFPDEVPQPEKPSSENQSTVNEPAPEKPSSENPTQLNTIYKQNTKEENIPSSEIEDSSDEEPSIETSDKSLKSEKGKRKKKKVAPKKKEWPEWCKEIGRIFLLALPENQRDITKKTADEWMDTIEKCNRLDGYTSEQIRDIVAWAKADDFWHDKLETPLKLRRTNNEKQKYIHVFFNQMESSKTPKKGKFEKHVDAVSEAAEMLGIKL